MCVLPWRFFVGRRAILCYLLCCFIFLPWCGSALGWEVGLRFRFSVVQAPNSAVAEKDVDDDCGLLSGFEPAWLIELTNGIVLNLTIVVGL